MNRETPKQRAEGLLKTFKSVYLSIECVSEIQKFASNHGIREPMMYWSAVKKELNKIKNT